MKVILIDYTPNPEKIVACAAKLCYSNSAIDTVYDSLDADKTQRFLEMLTEMGHESPIEHCSFTFGIEGVSRSFLAQVTRHRIASFSVQSQRYVQERDFSFVTPPEIEKDEQAKAIYLKSMDDAIESYRQLTASLSRTHTQTFLAQGYDEKTAAKLAEKKAIEDARFVLPNACDTQMIVTMNARSLLNFFRQRCCNRAQWEIHAVADEMLRLVKEVAPTIFSKAGPPCLLKACPEGKMSCRAQASVREKYGK